MRTKPVVARVAGSGWSLRHHRSGHVEQAFRFDRPGDYSVRFEAEADSLRLGKRLGDVRDEEIRRATGLVRIHVHSAPQPTGARTNPTVVAARNLEDHARALGLSQRAIRRLESDEAILQAFLEAADGRFDELARAIAEGKDRS